MEILSIIVPCYNEEEVLPLFYEEVTKVLSTMDVDYEIIYVDDGSKDKTSEVIKGFASKDTHSKYIIFSRNFGKEAAMYAGLKNSIGDYVVIMDADLQDPPHLLPEMLNSLRNEDYDCIGSRRVTRKGEPKIRSFFARQFYKIINKLSDIEISLLLDKLKENIGLKCPHGRPVAIKITRTEIDKWFKRII